MSLSLALTLPSTLQDELGLLRGSLDGVRWLGAEECIIPLQRLAGPTPSRPMLAELDMTLSRLHWEPFPLALHQVGHQPGEHEDRLTVGITPAGPVTALQKKLGSTLRRAGFSLPRRPPVPELTIARLEPASLTDLIPWIQRHNLFHTADMGVDHVCLLEHVPAAGERHTHVLETYPAQPGLALPGLILPGDRENRMEPDDPF